MICKFCNKGFTHEKTLIKHLCEGRRREQQKNEQFVQIGLNAYLRFYKRAFSQEKTYTDFVSSPYYLAFVKFGRYVKDVCCYKPTAFVDWLLDKNIALDHWAKDKNYDAFLRYWTYIENHMDAAERSLLNIADWGNEHDLPVGEYFKKASGPHIVNDIVYAKISPWIVYCSNSGAAWLSSCNQEQLKLMWAMLDPDRWTNKLNTDALGKLEVAALCSDIGL